MLIRPPPGGWPFILFCWPPLAPPGAPQYRDHEQGHEGSKRNSNELFGAAAHCLNISSTVVDVLHTAKIDLIALPDFDGSIDLSTLGNIAATLRGATSALATFVISTSILAYFGGF